MSGSFYTDIKELTAKKFVNKNVRKLEEALVLIRNSAAEGNNRIYIYYNEYVRERLRNMGFSVSDGTIMSVRWD